MYRSPIEVICNAAKMQMENDIFSAVQAHEIAVDKEELLRALMYDRGQYAKGYEDGLAAAMADLVYCRECEHWKKCESSLIGEVMCCTGQGSALIQKAANDFCSCGIKKED